MEKQIAVITGASSGIGRAFARSFAAKGYDLIITARRREVLEDLAQEYSLQYGINVEVTAFDLSDRDATERFAGSLTAKKNVAVLVNNAGFGSSRAFSADSFENQERMLTVHVHAATRLTHAVLPAMKSRNSGTVINVASMAGFFPAPLDALYSATKSYLIRFSEALQQELVDTGIRIQALCPGFIRTEFHERLGLGKEFNKKNSGIFRWMDADRLVRDSIRALERRNPPVIVLSGGFYKLLYLLHRVLPRKLIYRAMKGKMSNRVEG